MDRQILKTGDLGPFAQSPVFPNRWLRGIRAYWLPWYFTLVSANHTSSNPDLTLKNFRKTLALTELMNHELS